ncbi:uncharacterized protein LOC117109504 [Anneissia japonica]|uniref:uncharacterized protein LOC117109504 n=1 Tax=Anneissia japonica TaxID=1529436 RepID=UPI001425AA91|nr:uncharacterized protein LOC117109504 [Anneissia japonica]XP_033107765.1 uncharacterized protein LOC117109504 [Anneissia japonica]XP_033107766.1 uncharacterized protein LOC117109504 [Anneissia japonica]
MAAPRRTDIHGYGKYKKNIIEIASFLRELYEGNIPEVVDHDEESRPWEKMIDRPIYGRICTTSSADDMPVKLSDQPNRKTAFVFGPETVCSTLLQYQPYEMLIHLGFLPEYIEMKVKLHKKAFWVVLLYPESLPQSTPILPATWDGVLKFVQSSYPDAFQIVKQHLYVMKNNPVEFFEAQAGLKFIDVLHDPEGPNFMSYSRFRRLPPPQLEWETRLFLYCEVRIFELFTGNGFTKTANGLKGEREYICENYDLQKLGEGNYVAVPLTVHIPSAEGGNDDQ